MDILKRSMAPITAAAWEEIDAEATRVLKGNLSARGLVDFAGPEGWEKAAVNLGVMQLGGTELVDGVHWGMRQVQPLIELRVPFSLDIWDLDNVDRGAPAPDLEAVAAAARKIAMFEETTVYNGFADAQIKGICQEAGKPVPLTKDAGSFNAALEEGILTLQQRGIGGPYQLMLGTEAYKMVMAGDDRGYPLVRRVRELVGADIKWSPALTAGVLFSRRGGDYVFTCGQDLSIGYHAHDTRSVQMYVTESFTFQVLTPEAAAVFAWKS